MIGSEGTSSLVVLGQASPKVPLALVIEPGEVQGIFHAQGRRVNRHDGLGLNTMQPIIDYILNNKEWIFSGIGIFLLSGMIWFLSRLLFSNSPRTYGESGSHTTVHPERIKRESDIEARDNVGHRFEFLDGVIAYARLRGSYTIEDAKLFFSSFKSNGSTPVNRGE